MKEVVSSKKQPYKKNAKQETSSKKIKVEKPKPILGKRKAVKPNKKNEPKKYKQGVQIVPVGTTGKRIRENLNISETKKSRRNVEVDDIDAEFEDVSDAEFEDVDDSALRTHQGGDAEFEDAPPAAPPPGQGVEFDDVSEDAQSDDAQSDQSDDARPGGPARQNEGDVQAESKMSSKSSLQSLSKTQLTGLAPYGALLDKLSPDQIDQLIASGNGLTLDGRGLLKTRPSPLIVNRKRRQRSMRGNDGELIVF